MKLKLLSILIGIGLAQNLHAGDPVAGRSKAASCTACHGMKGISATDEWPNLAGQKPGYLIKQMKAYRDGSRTDPLMSPMATGLSDKDIEDIASYYHSLPMK